MIKFFDVDTANRSTIKRLPPSQMENLSRGEIIAQLFGTHGGIELTQDVQIASRLGSEYAPEQLTAHAATADFRLGD